MRNAPTKSEQKTILGRSWCQLSQFFGAPSVATAFFGAVFALLIYWLPQWGSALGSDAFWVYRLQVADPTSVPAVPEGIRLFMAAPMGLLEAWKAQYEAMQRLNMGDVVVWRIAASLAGDRAAVYLAISLACNVLSLVLLELTLEKIGIPWLLRMIAIVGLALAPAELWTSSVTSESRATVLFTLALFAAVQNLPIFSALSIGLAVTVKEPMLAWWPLVAALSLAYRGDRSWLRALVPHLAFAAAILAAGFAIILLTRARTGYAFFLKTPYPEISVFLSEVWRALEPTLLRPVGATAISAGLISLVIGIVSTGRMKMLLGKLSEPRWFGSLIAFLISLIGHLLVYWLTRRMVFDSRYVLPANFAFVVALLYFAEPFVSTAPRAAKIIAVAVSSVVVARTFPWRNLELFVLASMLAGFAVIIVMIWMLLTGTARRRSIAVVAAALGSVAFLATPLIDARLSTGFQEQTDAASWERFVNDVAAHASPQAYILLKTEDVFMIETAWALQAELLLRHRGDIVLWLQATDTSFLDNETGLLRFAHEAYNFGRPTSEEAARMGRPIATITVNRRGRARSGRKPELRPGKWAWLLLTSPTDFLQARYRSWQAGYLNYSWIN